MGVPKTQNIMRFANPNAYDTLSWQANEGSLPKQKKDIQPSSPLRKKVAHHSESFRSVAKVPKGQIALSPSRTKDKLDGRNTS